MPVAWPSMRSTARWVLPVLVGPRTATRREEDLPIGESVIGVRWGRTGRGASEENCAAAGREIRLPHSPSQDGRSCERRALLRTPFRGRARAKGWRVGRQTCLARAARVSGGIAELTNYHCKSKGASRSFSSIRWRQFWSVSENATRQSCARERSLDKRLGASQRRPSDRSKPGRSFGRHPSRK